MNEVAIRVENLYKQYRLGVIGAETLKDDIKLGFAKLFGKSVEDIHKIESNDRLVEGSEYVWALDNINFEVKKGEILGVIGKNGAGKSTLLKLLSKVTGPTKGEIKVNGRIASLLEVGTGFHPELTGRENIFLNGAILGMTKSEIRSKLDEIIEFSGIGKYLDTPVKRYSSGMKVRLGFAVAAHLEPDILIVDEVLAVGDAEFQKKCIGKMNDVSKNQGRTVLFVSHNMSSVLELCDRGLLMGHGRVEYVGDIQTTVAKYLNEYKAETIEKDLTKVTKRHGNARVQFTFCGIEDIFGNEIDSVLCGQDFKIKLKLKNELIESDKLHISLKIVDEKDRSIAHISNAIGNGKEFFVNPGEEVNVSLNLKKLPLNEGEYFFHLFCSNTRLVFDEINFAGKLVVGGGNFYASGKLPKVAHSPLLIDYNFSID